MKKFFKDFATPLRYPGGKSKLANFMKEVFRLNDLIGGQYVEAYAGGASIALHLLFSDYASHIHINDLDRSVYSFWFAAVNETEDLCRLIRDTPVNMKHWRQQRAIQQEPNNHSRLELGFSTFFLNRTNHSGIITGGPIGGEKQKGDWLMTARYNKTQLIARIKRIANFRDRITLYNKDAAEILTKIVPALPEKSLVYLDPPYYSKGRGLYKNDYSHKDHVAIAGIIGKVKTKWIVSYDDAAEIHKLYSKFRGQTYKLRYSARDNYAGSEAIFFSNNLILPAVETPVMIKIPKSNLIRTSTTI
jgi:DNA adenine methylase